VLENAVPIQDFCYAVFLDTGGQPTSFQDEMNNERTIRRAIVALSRSFSSLSIEDRKGTVIALKVKDGLIRFSDREL
jgi:hypothetical protein